jgi:cytochrome c oxidase assembly protein subunit 15
MTSFLKADRSPAVASWLFVVAILVLAMVMVGGATRLTDSGLSITEWKPVTGTIPPLSDQAWAAEFAKYRATPQYRLVNEGMNLGQFQAIYWWEWVHRFLGRLVGAVFVIPFAWFLFRREIPPRLILRFFGLLALGGLQGLVGWWMVKSGLENRVSVAPERLALHLALALFLFGALIWCALEAWAGQGRIEDKGPWARGGLALSGLIFLQIMLGALVAGNRAGKIYNDDWPLMGGRIIPSDYLGNGLWDTIAHNGASVQFNHRLLAYGVLVLVVAFAVTAWRSRLIQPDVRRLTISLAALAMFQVFLGVVTLRAAAPLPLSMLHQATAALLLGLAVALTWRARRI